MNPITKLIAAVIVGMIAVTLAVVVGLLVFAGHNNAAPAYYAASSYAARGGGHGHGHH
jgi:hypothetical protein